MDNKKEMLKCFNIARRRGFEGLNLFFASYLCGSNAVQILSFIT